MSKQPNCADCGGIDLEWMRRCAKHGTEVCRGCSCPGCDEEAWDDYEEDGPQDLEDQKESHVDDIATQLENSAKALARGDDASMDLITRAVRALREKSSVTINDYALLRAVEYRGGIFSGTDITIEWMEGHEDGNGYVIYDTEYPEEGPMMLDHGPLTEDFECIVCHVCGNQRTIANGATGTDPRGYSDCTNCSDHKGPTGQS